MSDADRTHWNQRYRSGRGPESARASQRLAKYAAFVDQLAASRRAAGFQPQALDVACGAGGTVLWLAKRGWHATGVDVSDAALEYARAAQDVQPVLGQAHFVQEDLDSWRPQAQSVDLISVFFYWDRALLPELTAAVRPDGLLIYETFNLHRLTERPETRVDFLLQPGELAHALRGLGWTILASHSDDATALRPTDGVVAQRPVA
jgi:tellurite methyltransferase